MTTPRRRLARAIHTRHAILYITGALFVVTGVGFLTADPPLPSLFRGVSQGWVWVVAGVVAGVTARMPRASNAAIGLLIFVVAERIIILVMLFVTHTNSWFNASFYLYPLALVGWAILTPNAPEDTEPLHG